MMSSVERGSASSAAAGGCSPRVDAGDRRVGAVEHDVLGLLDVDPAPS